MSIYLTLDDALADVAKRSFSEDCLIEPLSSNDNTIHAYRVSDDSPYISEDWTWTYEDGLAHPSLSENANVETSRLHDANERYDNAEHIRYNLPELVEALESGKNVAFSYAIVSDSDLSWDDIDSVYYDADGWTGVTDNTAGWILVGIAYD